MDEQLMRYFSGELTEQERLDLILSVEYDSLIKADFIRLQNLTAVTQLSFLPADRNEGKNYFETFTNQFKRNTRKKLTVNIAKYAAIALILVASTVWVTLYFTSKTLETSMNTLHVPAGQRARLTLQDGTEVWLNAQSTLKYPSHFSRKKREVEITGEAFFNVAKQKKQPFIVSTQHIDIEVLGTQFNVYSYPDADFIQTDLVRGALRVSEKQHKENTVILASNEQVTFREGKMSISRITNPYHVLWKEGIYAFNNERLIDIIDKLQLYYDIKIIVEGPEIFEVRYTGKFRQRDGIDEILNIIQKIHPFKIQRDRDNNFIILTK